jgi:integrase
MRIAELFNLTWKQVDLKSEQVTFPGKGDKIRTVPLNDKAMEILRRRQGHKVKHISGRVFREIESIDSIN